MYLLAQACSPTRRLTTGCLNICCLNFVDAANNGALQSKKPTYPNGFDCREKTADCTDVSYPPCPTTSGNGLSALLFINAKVMKGKIRLRDDRLVILAVTSTRPPALSLAVHNEHKYHTHCSNHFHTRSVRHSPVTVSKLHKHGRRSQQNKQIN